MRQLLATDLDGTILGRDQIFHPNDISVLNQLGKSKVVRVIATGRNLHSALQVIPADFPIDYLVFSSGAGLYDWNRKQILSAFHLGYERAKELVGIFRKYGVEHTLHLPIPENHRFLYSVEQHKHPDFLRYIQLHGSNAVPMNGNVIDQRYTQTLAFIPDMDLFEKISGLLTDVKSVRATSPIDGKSIWMECFHPRVSKANGIRQVCELTNTHSSQVTVVGNDYNDLDMLKAFEKAFVVQNAPEELRLTHPQLKGVKEAPLADWYHRIAFPGN
ncbi:MAG: HAD family phosphatase [Marinilabiliaceae bacterium]|nr:HAD family phosphatase [Marinilabiliaceae bacterium]